MSKLAAVFGFAALASATWASSSSAAAPAASSALPECWSSCFASNGVTSESAACGNTAVDACIHDTCSEELDQKYWSWYDSYCGSSSSSAIPVSTAVPSSSAGPWSSSVPAESSSPNSYPGWGSSSSAAYPVPSGSSYYPSSYGSAPSSSWYPSSSIVQPISSSTVPSGTPTPTCWSECFQKAGITEESQLCGNTEVDECIHDSCCKEEDEAYWAWYDSFCPAPSSSTPVSPVSSSAVPYPSGSSYSWGVSSSEPSSPVSSSAVPYPSGSSYSWGVASSSIVPYPSGSSSACPARSTTPIWRSSYIPSSSIPVGPASSSYSWGVVSSSAIPYPSGSSSSWGAVSSSAVPYPSGSSYSWGVISSSYVPSSSVPVGPASSSSYPSSTPTVDCWSKCFAENDITSEDELCGNTAVDKCISETCSCEKDKQYWQWYESFCTAAPSSSLVSPTTTTAPVVPATSTAGCWGACFAKAGISSESELCDNTAVDQCIHDTCSPAEDKAYWQWYNAYCPATTSVSITIPATSPATSPATTPATSPASPVATPTGGSGSGNCWSVCFAQSGVTSEASLCGNDEVSKCIHDTCSSALDQAYWAWYNSYCAPASSSVVTIVTTALVTPVPSGSPSGYPAGPTGESSVITTTIVSTVTYPATAKESSPVTGFPSPPASSPAGPAGYSAPASSPVAPVGYSTPASSPVTPVGYSTLASSPVGPVGYSTGAAQPTGAYPSASSTWAPVPATGAGAANKPGFVLAVAVAFVALL